MIQKCNGTTYCSKWGGLSCRNTATRDGYCWIHHPDAEAKRRAAGRARNAELLRKSRAEADAREAEAARARKLAELAERLILSIRADDIGIHLLVWDDECQDTLRELYEMRKEDA